MTKVGFIGLGIIGSPMALQLVTNSACSAAAAFQLISLRAAMSASPERRPPDAAML